MPHNVFEDENTSPFEDLSDLIHFDGFDVDNWRRSEMDLLEPRLRELGFSDIRWGPGETDSFGPLTRICTATDQNGIKRRFIYG